MGEPGLVFILSRADELYRRRGQPRAVQESVSLLAASDAATEHFEVQWRLARALFFLGQQACTRDEKRQLHAAAVHAGQLACSLIPDRVEGHFWLGVNLALFAEVSRALKAARAVLRARRELRRAASICEGYHGAGPLRVLGRLEHRAPRLLGGSRGRSLQYFERSLSKESNSVTLIYAAELLCEIGERDRAAALLEQLLALPDNPDWEFENLRDRELARKMLEQLA